MPNVYSFIRTFVYMNVRICVYLWRIALHCFDVVKNYNHLLITHLAQLKYKVLTDDLQMLILKFIVQCTNALWMEGFGRLDVCTLELEME